LLFCSVCLQAFGAFSCQLLRDGTSVMVSAPEILCWESAEHSTMVGVSVVALIIYVFGVPAFTLCITLYGHLKDKLRDPTVLQLFGIFYREYEPEYYWWDVVFLLRRFFLCLCAVVFQNNSAAQAGIAIVVIVIATLLQFVAQPFWDKRVNHLDCFCCVVIMLHLIAFLYFNNEEFVASAAAEKLDSLLFSFDVIAMIAITALFAITLTENYFKRISISRLTAAVSVMFVSMQQELRAKRDDFLRLLDEELQASRPTDESGVGQVEDLVSVEAFMRATVQTLRDSAVQPSGWAIQSVFFILKLVHGDDDEHSTYLSPSMRKELASNQSGIPKTLVIQHADRSMRYSPCSMLGMSPMVVSLQCHADTGVSRRRFPCVAEVAKAHATPQDVNRFRQTDGFRLAAFQRR
jgi:hypothetical protein